MNFHKYIQIILIAIILGVFIGGGFCFIICRQSKSEEIQPPTSQTKEQDLLLLEKEQMFGAAREYIKPDTVEGMESDFEIIKQIDKWTLLRIIPINIETDNAAMILEKVDGEWKPRAWGTILPGWKEKVPELFEFE